jgi:hypothetical protein
MSRRLKPNETAILERLLEAPFPGRDAVREQISRSRVKLIDEYHDNYGSLEFEVAGGPKAPDDLRVPVNASALDSDGVPIEIFLHIVNGLVDELEIVKADGSPIIRPPEASELTVRLMPWLPDER